MGQLPEKACSLAENGSNTCSHDRFGTLRDLSRMDFSGKVGKFTRPGPVIWVENAGIVACVIRAKTDGRFGGSRTRKTADAVQPNGRNRTAVSADGVQPFRAAEQSERPIRTGEGLSAAVSWKPRRHVASLLEIANFNEGGLRAAEEIIHAPDHRGPAAECAGAQP